VDLLDGVTGLLVGVDSATQRETLTVDVPAGSVLIAYTDGLIERPGADLDRGIAELAGRLGAAPPDADPQQLCDVAVSGPLDRRDDVALIAVRFE
jgi:serine phosphatase RsbU (regulator of sigma subunit)